MSHYDSSKGVIGENENGRTRSVNRTTGRTSRTAKIRKVDARRPTQELGA